MTIGRRRAQLPNCLAQRVVAGNGYVGLLEEIAQGVPRPRFGQAGEPSTRNRESPRLLAKIQPREVVQEGTGFAESVRSGSQVSACGRNRALQAGQHFSPKVISPQGRIRVAFVLDPCESMFLRVVLQNLAFQMEQRSQEPPPPRAHPGRRRWASTAAEIEENGLGLVVEMMSEKNRVSIRRLERAVSGDTRGSLQADASGGRHSNAFYSQWHTEVPAYGAAESLPAECIGTDPVIHVDRADGDGARPRDRYRDMQQNRRVQAARVGDDDGRRGTGSLDGGANRRRYRLIRPAVP